MLFIFDWDGTISDSASKIVGCVRAAAVDTGLPSLDDDAIKNIIGLGLSEACQMLYPGIDEHTERQFRSAYSTHFTERDKVPSPFFPNVMNVLETLKSEGHCLAVATGKSRKGLDRVLRNLQLDDFFDFSRCADETASKPDPLMLIELLNVSATPVEQSVLVGDTEWDMVMADNANMKKIAVSYGAHTPERLEHFKPERLISDFREVLDWYEEAKEATPSIK